MASTAERHQWGERKEMRYPFSFFKKLILAMLIAFPISLAGVFLIFSSNVILTGKSAELINLVKHGAWMMVKFSILISIIGSLITVLSPGRTKR